jgi:hypothetical protein
MLKTVGFPSTRTGDQTIVDGNLVIGTAGKGIDFSATPGTGTSELLDDYEEGTWTPTFIATGTALDSVTYDFAAGTYTKIGNVVQCSVNIRSSAITIGAATGDAAVGGLPFAALDTGATPKIGRYSNWATVPSGFRPFNNRMTCTADNSTAALTPAAAFNTGGFANFLNYTFFYYTSE